MKKVLIVVGTRPNIVKVTRFRDVAAGRRGLEVRLVHTGQHFSANMADVFFTQFGLTPDRCLGIAPASPTQQIADIMVGLEKVIEEERPDLVMVVGDVNSTLAAAIAANKKGVRIGHLESGLRSFDRSMPEEHNRVVVDLLADAHFITESSGVENLTREGRAADSLHFVGNTMIDTLVAFDPQVQAAPILEDLGLPARGHVLMTMHRPATVDSPERLAELLDLAEDVCRTNPIVFPIHPRTAKNLATFGLEDRVAAIKGLRLTEPLDYFAFQKLVATAAFILTDSGGIQEESTFRRVPCLTLRPNTERPVTITLGTNELISSDISAVHEAIGRIRSGQFKTGSIPPLWDGHATERICDVLERIL